jgi:hypothetical protein
MALSTQNRNLIVDMMNWAEAQIALRDTGALIVARWNQNDVLNALTDEDIAEIFPHLTKDEVANAINAINAVLTALGDNSSGQSVNLIKLKG